MKRANREQKLSIAMTDYGWALDSEAGRIGLFMSQRQAVTSARAHIRSCKAIGITSKLVVTGSDAEYDRKFVTHFSRFR